MRSEMPVQAIIHVPMANVSRIGPDLKVTIVNAIQATSKTDKADVRTLMNAKKDSALTEFAGTYCKKRNLAKNHRCQWIIIAGTKMDPLIVNVRPDFTYPVMADNVQITTNVNRLECVPMASAPIWTALSNVNARKDSNCHCLDFLALTLTNVARIH